MPLSISKNKLEQVCNVLYCVALLLLFIDVYRSGTTVSKYFIFSSRWLTLFLCIVLGYIRLTYKTIVSTSLWRLNRVICIGIFAISVALTLIDYNLGPNTVYARIQIQYSQLLIISIVSGFVWLASFSDGWFKKYDQLMIYLSAPVLMSVAFIVSLFPFDVFSKLSAEDRLIENMQVIILLVCALWSLKIAKKFLSSKKTILAFIFFLGMLGFLFVAGDEVAWGQRVFHLETSAYLQRYNTQQEITLHNLEQIGGAVNLGYIVLGACGTLGWLIAGLFPLFGRRPFSYFIVPRFGVLYFGVGFYYNLYIYLGYQSLLVWSEFVELLLYAGIMVSLYYWRRLQIQRV